MNLKDIVKHTIEGYRGYLGPYVTQLITLALLAACLLSSINAFVFLGFLCIAPFKVSALIGGLENVRTKTHIFNKFHGDFALVVNRVKMVRVGLRPHLETTNSRIHDELDVIPAMKDLTQFFDNHVVLLGTQGRQLAIIDVPATFLEVDHLDSESIRHQCAHAILIEIIILPAQSFNGKTFAILDMDLWHPVKAVVKDTIDTSGGVEPLFLAGIVFLAENTVSSDVVHKVDNTSNNNQVDEISAMNGRGFHVDGNGGLVTMSDSGS